MSIWKTKTGRVSRSRASRKSDLEEYGVGIVVYFQFVKYIACVYFIMAVLSLPAMFFFYYGNKNKASWTDMITKVSVGNIGDSPFACADDMFLETNIGDDFQDSTAFMNLSCRYGTLETMTNFG